MKTSRKNAKFEPLKLPVMTAAKMMIAIATAATSSCGSRPLTRRPPPERVPSSLAN